MSTNKLFSHYQLGKIELKNRIVMSPMTRSRAIENIPNEVIAAYYAQRADAGLIITEGTSPSPNGLGYARIPGLFNSQQIEGWKKVTNAVHAKGGRIFVQLMHTGRIGHEKNLPQGANGYLIEQFFSPFANLRTDEYGGSIENRTKFAIEIAREISNAIGKEKVGIRVSPYGVASDMKPYPEIDDTYAYLAKELGKIGIVYMHVVDHSSMGAPKVPLSIKHTIREQFGGTIILAGGYDKQKAESDLQHGNADLIGFGKPFINNPDFVLRLENDLPLSTNLDTSTFYSVGEKGYLDYPVYEQELATA